MGGHGGARREGRGRLPLRAPRADPHRRRIPRLEAIGAPASRARDPPTRTRAPLMRGAAPCAAARLPIDRPLAVAHPPHRRRSPRSRRRRRRRAGRVAVGDAPRRESSTVLHPRTVARIRWAYRARFGRRGTARARTRGRRVPPRIPPTCPRRRHGSLARWCAGDARCVRSAHGLATCQKRGGDARGVRAAAILQRGVPGAWTHPPAHQRTRTIICRRDSDAAVDRLRSAL